MVQLITPRPNLIEPALRTRRHLLPPSSKMISAGLDLQWDDAIRATADKLPRHISEGAREAFAHERGALAFAPFGKFDRLDDKAVGAKKRRARNLSIANSSIWSRWILKTSRAAIPG
jgi:hypothetical protein